MPSARLRDIPSVRDLVQQHRRVSADIDRIEAELGQVRSAVRAQAAESERKRRKLGASGGTATLTADFGPAEDMQRELVALTKTRKAIQAEIDRVRDTESKVELDRMLPQRIEAIRAIHRAYVGLLEAHRAQDAIVEELNKRDVRTGSVAWPGLGDSRHIEPYIVAFERLAMSHYRLDLQAERQRNGVFLRSNS